MSRYYLNIFLIVFLLAAAGISFAQQHRDDRNYDDRRVPMIYDKTDGLLNKIKEKLNDLDSDYLTKLSRRDYKHAQNELNKIYELIEAVKNQQNIDKTPPVAAMSDPDFRALVNSINNESFEENKVAVLQASVKYHNYTVDQIIALMDLSTFSSWKLKVLELTYPYVVDKNNSFKIINSLSFSEDKQKAQAILERN